MHVTVKQTRNTPNVEFHGGHLYIRGKSIPTLHLEFCRKFLEMVKDYARHPEPVTKIDVKLDCINGYSERCMMESFKVLEKLKSKGNEVIINWFYQRDDEYMLELGLIYRSMLKLTFQFFEDDSLIIDKKGA